MTSLTLLFLIVPVLVLILLTVNLFLAAHRPDSEKVTAYECGFSPIYGQTRAPFNIQFYLVGLLFLIFDLELVLIGPWCLVLYEISAYGFWIGSIFFIVLTLGLVYELGKGALNFTDQRSSINRLTIKNTSEINQSSDSTQYRLIDLNPPKY